MREERGGEGPLSEDERWKGSCSPTSLRKLAFGFHIFVTPWLFHTLQFVPSARKLVRMRVYVFLGGGGGGACVRDSVYSSLVCLFVCVRAYARAWFVHNHN